MVSVMDNLVDRHAFHLQSRFLDQFVHDARRPLAVPVDHHNGGFKQCRRRYQRHLRLGKRIRLGYSVLLLVQDSNQIR